MLSLHTEMLVSPGFSTVLRCWFLYCSNSRLKLPDILSFQVEVLTKLSTPFFPWGGILLQQIQLFALRITVSYSRLYYVGYMRSGLYHLVIRVKGFRVCALHCVHTVTSFSIAFEVLSIGVYITFSESSFVSLAHGPRWLFLLSHHREAISATLF